MNTKFYYLSIVLAALAFSTLDSQLSTAHAQGTAFTYQGRLNDGVNPASGSYDVKFTLFDTNATGTIVAGPLTNSTTAVSNGSFIVTLDFGSAPFDGGDRWLEIAVRTNGGGSFSTLTPRQPVTAVPYAINSLTAGSVAGLRVTGNRNASPNVIGGANVNYVAPTVVGATIGGGGATGSGVSNSISGDYSTIGGGLNNTVQNIKSTIGGGFNNIIEGDSHFAMIGGGSENKIHLGSANGTIAGGYNNALQSPASYSFIGGGNGNYVSGTSSVIGGGDNNLVQSQAAVIGGGIGNTVKPLALLGTIGGGYGNHVTGMGAVIGGGGYDGTAYWGNAANGNASVIAGGLANTNNDLSGTIGGGFKNAIQGSALGGSSIGGGAFNNIQINAWESTIGGGVANTIQPFATYSTISGGYYNKVTGSLGTVPGGGNNEATNWAFAAGMGAKAIHIGSFVWADYTGPDFASTGNNQFLIRASGGVGIGRNNPATALDVNGIVNATDFYKNGSPFGSSLWVSSGGNIYYSGGNVGIGTTTPGTTLHVQAPQAVGRFQSTGSPNGSVIEIWNNTGGSAPAGAINFIRTNTFRGQIGYLANDSMTFTAGGVERMRISGGGLFGVDAGNVGIGTTSPGGKLSIFNNTSSEPLLKLEDSRDDVFYSRYLSKESFYDTGGEAAYVGLEHNFGEGPAPRALVFGLSADGNPPTEKMRITRDGNVGIGTASPNSSLEVRGNVKFGPSGEYHVVGAEEALRTIRGTVNLDGSIQAGSGFSVTITSLPDSKVGYNIFFAPNFGGTPSVVVTRYTGSGDYALATSDRPTAAKAQIVGPIVIGGPGGGAAGAFDFIAVGPR